MCGILGQISFKEPKPLELDLKSIAHRGPDGQGIWSNKDDTVHLGHTRLAILDPSPSGAQPMQDASKRFTITFNGEIYNHLTLRKALPDVKWRGNSDTETLLELFAREQHACLDKLEGMFAFAIYDALNESVLLVRDRLGIKPLWLKSDDTKFQFSSEVRTLIRPEQFRPNTTFLQGYIGFGRVPGTGEIMDGIAAVPPGTWIQLSANGQRTKETWWPKVPFTKSTIGSKTEATAHIKKLTTQAITAHLISDVGVGAFLSGGIDSSIVALVAGKELGKNLQTFTVGFPQGAFDERAIARQVAKRAGSTHTEIEVREEDCLAWVKEAVLSLDLPSVDAINTYIVSKAVRNTGLKVALSGLGGDELFAGYPSFSQIPKLGWLHSLPISISKMLMGMGPKSLNEKFAGLPKYDISTLTRNRRRFTGIDKLQQWGWDPDSPDGWKEIQSLDTLAKISWAEIQSYMIPMLLRDSDQMSMAVGLEIRVPFLDHRLVEEALVIPQKYKKGSGVKPLLVDAFKDVLPIEVYNRPKQGFELPMRDWISGPLASFTEFGLHRAAANLGLNEPLLIKDEFDHGRVHWTRIWHWCVLGHWLHNQKAQKTMEKTKR